jgi:hypothetical protein
MGEIDSGREHVAKAARRLVRGGYDSREDIIETVNDRIADLQIEGLSAIELVDAEISSLVEESASWPPVTDYDRLIDAFTRLEEEGIVMRENFTCCGTCGAAEIGYEIDFYREQGKLAVGYGFFHQQGTESAVDGYDLNFSYGSTVQDATGASDIAIGKRLADEMLKAGLKVDWNGELRMCVMVGVKWQRRWGTESRFAQQA